MLRGVIYTRLSAKSKGERNAVNLDAQEADCRKLAEGAGAVLVHPTIRDYGASAFNRENPDDREGYAELCELVRDRAVDVVFAWHTDRLWRSDLDKALFIRDAQRVRLARVITKTANIDPQNADDEFLLTILNGVAVKESADKSRRGKRKIRANAEAGLPHGPNRPFGYDDDKITIREAEAVLVRAFAKRLLSGETLNSVTKWANTTGVTPTRGGAWQSQQVRSVAISYRYCGLRATGKGVDASVVADAVWKPIITRAQTDKLRALLLDPARRTNRSARSYLLSGLVVCGRCDHKMVSRARHGRPNEAVRRTYACNENEGTAGCGRARIVAEPLEQIVTDALSRHVSTKRFRDALAKAARNGADASVSTELRAIDAKEATLAEQWAGDRLSDGEWAAARKTLTERRARLATHARKSAIVPDVLADYADNPERIAAEFPTMPFDRQRAILTALLGGVVIGPAKPGTSRFDPTRIESFRWRTLPTR